MAAFILVSIGALLFFGMLAGHLRMQRMLTGNPSSAVRLRTYPSITVIRPIKGLDVGCRENTEALLEQDYPGDIELLFVFDSASDPAYPGVSSVVAEAGGRARVLVVGPPPARRTGKLNAMICAMREAHGELVAFCDSDSRPAPALLRQLVDELLDRPDAADTFARAITLDRPTSFAEAVYGLMMNSWYGAAAVEFAGPKRELPFIMGQLMVFRRDALAAIGGLEAAEGQLVDDMFLGKKLAEAGYKNVMVRAPLHLVSGPLGLRELSALLRKWMAFSRSGLPAEFVRGNWLRGAELTLALGTTGAALATGHVLAALAPAAALILSLYSQLSLHRRFSGTRVPLRFAWVALVLPIVAGVLLLSTHLKRQVEWRGSSYRLDADARLASARFSTISEAK